MFKSNYEFNVKLFSTIRGKPKLYYCGYFYTIHKSNIQSIYWRCAFSRCKCKMTSNKNLRTIVNEESINSIIFKGQHHHNPDAVILDAMKMAEFAKLEKKENTRAIPNVMINLPHSAQIRIKTGIDKIMRKKKSPVKYNPRKLGNNLNKIAEDLLRKMESNKKIECVLTEELNEAKYQHPLRFNYKINGIMNTWEVMLYYDCVEILIFNITRNVFIFVKQFRPPVYLNKLLRENNLLSECLKKIERKYYLKDLLNDKTILPASHGYTIELCAGLIDRKDTALNIANAEVFEEVGYSVKTKNMHKINTYVSCTGLLGNETSIYFAVVEDCDKTSPGGGIGNENIEIIEVAETEMENFIKCTPNIPNVLHFSYMWFLLNKSKYI